VGIGLLPATAYNPLFAAMEITTLARLYPNRLIVGYGHGVDHWMKQIGASPKSSMKALEETVMIVRRLLQGEAVTFQGSQVFMDNVKMTTTPDVIPPLYIGAMREKTLQLAGRVGDGTILTAMVTPDYIRWAKTHIDGGRTEASPAQNRVVTYALAKVLPDGEAARAIARKVIARHLRGSEPQLAASELWEQAQALFQSHSPDDVAALMPESWIDELTATGTPEQAMVAISRLAAAGADCIILQPLDDDPVCLDEYARYLMPTLRADTKVG
jgi:alkanesulfonate monooxygenase SsuD/methylene tetrahydromethanopterin reductase-like flavin-dependent oxidoreductase (luciferase family)